MATINALVNIYTRHRIVDSIPHRHGEAADAGAVERTKCICTDGIGRVTADISKHTLLNIPALRNRIWGKPANAVTLEASRYICAFRKCQVAVVDIEGAFINRHTGETISSEEGVALAVKTAYLVCAGGICAAG